MARRETKAKQKLDPRPVIGSLCLGVHSTSPFGLELMAVSLSNGFVAE